MMDLACFIKAFGLFAEPDPRIDFSLKSMRDKSK